MHRALNPVPSLLGALCAVAALSLPVPADASRHGTGGAQPSKSKAGPSATHQRHALTIPAGQAQSIANAALQAQRQGKQGIVNGQGARAARSGPRRVQFKPSPTQSSKNAALTATRKGTDRVVASSKDGVSPGSSKKARGKEGRKKTLSVQTSGPETNAAGSSGRPLAGVFAPVRPPAPSKKVHRGKPGKTKTLSVQSRVTTASEFLERAPWSTDNR